MLMAPHTISMAYSKTITQSTDLKSDGDEYLVFLNST